MTHVACEDCAHFIRDDINPATGLGFCSKRLGSHYPMQLHGCRSFKPHDEGAADERISEQGHDRH